MKQYIMTGIATMLVVGCVSTTSELPESVTFENGVYTIPEQGITVNGEEDIPFELSAGTYKFRVVKSWHRENIEDIAVQEDELQFIKVEPGKGFAQGKVSVTPENSVFTLNGYSYTGMFDGELESGNYTISASAPGYSPGHFSVEVKTGSSFDHSFILNPVPTGDTFVISTQPAGAIVYVDNEKKGTSPVYLDSLSYGKHSVYAELYLSKNSRVTRNIELVFTQDSKKELDVALNHAEKQFEGRWIATAEADRLIREKALLKARQEQEQAKKLAAEAEAAEALALAKQKEQEERYYRSLRVNQPVEVRFKVVSLKDQKDMTEADFSKALFALLNVGDRIKVELNDKSYSIWKRSENINESFLSQVSALWQEEPIGFDYASDPVKALNYSQGSSLITTLAYQMYRSQNKNPVIELDESMHQLTGYQLPASSVDTTVITIGGSNILLNGESIEVTPLIGMKKLRNGYSSIDIRWKKKPVKLLVVSRNETPLSSLPLNQQINVNEKKLIQLIKNGTVQKIDRFTSVPGKGWSSDHIERSGPLGDSMDLNVNEIGPHDLAGQYKRVWVIDFIDASGTLQKRQLSMSYAVGEQVQQTESDSFFRRKVN